MSEFNINTIVKDFPTLETKIYGKRLIYLDNAATNLKPRSVINSIHEYYSQGTSNVHRGLHYLSEKATDKYEMTRDKIKSFINARDRKEIIFTKGTTDSINLVAATYGLEFLKEGDEILVSEMEHHSNIVPWQLLAKKTGIKIKVIPINDEGEILLEEYEALLNEKTKLVSVVYISNALGTINPIKKMIEMAHQKGAKFLVDAAQAMAHTKIDVQDLDADFLAFSAHKMLGPTGVGALYAKEELLEQMPPYQGGGDMIDVVSFEKTTFNDLPYKFEAGTPNISGVIALFHAIEYLEKIGLENIISYEDELLQYGTKRLQEIDGLKIIGIAKKKTSILSFAIKDIHPHDLATFTDKFGIAIRTGHHCAQPLMKRMGVVATTRASLSLYNTKKDIDELIYALKKAEEIFR